MEEVEDAEMFEVHNVDDEDEEMDEEMDIEDDLQPRADPVFY